MTDYTPLYNRIDYRFKDESLLDLAMTHSSKSNEANYERLEFLGDRILGFVIANLLFEKFVEEPEGKLARRFMNLVRQETLASIAREIDLSPYIQLSWGEEKTGGSEKDSLLADCLESLLAALYLDGGIVPVQKLIQKYWVNFLHDSLTSEKDPKSQLQELVQGQGKPLPVYDMVEVTGSKHTPTYVMQVTVQGAAPVNGIGSSKRAAMQDAAEKLLSVLKGE